MPTTTQKQTPWQQACRITGNDPEAKYSAEEKADIVYRASCRILGKNPEHLPDCFAVDAEFHPSLIALYKLQLIARAVNPKGWIQDWNSWEQPKWAPWFYMSKPGFRFRVAFCVIVYADGTGGSRLSLSTESRARFMGTYCVALYRDLMGGGELAPNS